MASAARIALFVIASTLAIGVVVATRNASAGEVECGPGVERWVRAAARETGTSLRTRSCPMGRVVVHIEPVDAPAFDVEIAEGDGPAFRRVDRFRVSPLLEVEDFGAIPRPQRDAFERVVAFLAAHASEVTLAEPGVLAWTGAGSRQLDVGFGGPWLMLAAIAILAAVLAGRRARRIASRDAQLFATTFAVSLVLRLVLGAWGPLRINGMAPLWILGAASAPEETAGYGPGYPEIFAAVARLAPTAPDTAIFVANAALSALAPALAFTLARSAALARSHAMLAALALAVDPIAIRVATSEAYFHPILALTLAASVVAIDAASHAARGERLRALGLAVAMALLLAQAARIHPSAWAPAALAPFAALACGESMTTRRRALGVVALGAIASAVIAITSGAALVAVAEHVARGDTFRPRAFLPGAAGAVVLVAFAIACVRLPRARWLAIVAAIFLAVLFVTRKNYAQSDLWLASYDRLYLAVPIVAVAACIPPTWLARRSVTAALIAVPLVALGVWGPFVLGGRTTEQLEYSWIRRWLTTLPPECRTTHVAFAARHNLLLPTYVASARANRMFVRIDARQPVNVAQALGAPGCAFYLRTSLCSTTGGRAACDDVERQLDLEPIVRTSFPAVPDSTETTFDRDSIDIVISRIAGVHP